MLGTPLCSSEYLAAWLDLCQVPGGREACHAIIGMAQRIHSVGTRSRKLLWHGGCTWAQRRKSCGTLD